MPKRYWDLDTGVALARELEIHMAPKYHVALAGSVLHKGESFKDLDLIILPRRVPDNDPAEVKMLLEAFGMKLVVPLKRVREEWAKKHDSLDTKHVEVWYINSRRIDVIQPWA